MAGQSRCLQNVNCWNFLKNSRVYVVLLIGPWLLPLPLFTLYVCVHINVALGCNLLKHAFGMQEMVASVSNREMVSFLLIGVKWGSLISSGSHFLFLDAHVCPVISFSWSLVLCYLHLCLPEWIELLWLVLWWWLSVTGVICYVYMTF